MCVCVCVRVRVCVRVCACACVQYDFKFNVTILLFLQNEPTVFFRNVWTSSVDAQAIASHTLLKKYISPLSRCCKEALATKILQTCLSKIFS